MDRAVPGHVGQGGPQAAPEAGGATGSAAPQRADTVAGPTGLTAYVHSRRPAQYAAAVDTEHAPGADRRRHALGLQVR